MEPMGYDGFWRDNEVGEPGKCAAMGARHRYEEDNRINYVPAAKRLDDSRYDVAREL
jgi:hypothetical protein